MTQAQAMAAAQALAGHLRRYGVPVSIELQTGAGSNGWGPAPFVATMGHHTVSRRSQGPTPCLRLVKVGRPDVPGPLCNGYLGWDGVARIITMGYANHPGAGGPIVVDGVRIPANNARPYTFGWEMEGGLDAADWTPEYRRAMAACLAGTLDWLGVGTGRHIEHRTWTTRKIDRLGYTAESARAEIAAIRGGSSSPSSPPPVEDDMYDAGAEARLFARLAEIGGAAATAAANADRAAARADASAKNAATAAQLGLEALGLARQTLLEVQAGRDDIGTGTAAALARLEDMRARMPRVNTARYDRVAVPTYGALADAAEGTTYLELSGALAGVSASVELAPGDLAAIGAAVQVPHTMTGTVTLEAGQ